MKGDEESNSARKALEKVVMSNIENDVLKLHDQVAELKADLPFILKSIREATCNLEQTLAPQNELAEAELKRFIQVELKDIYIHARQAKEAALKGVEAAINDSARQGWLGTKIEAAEAFKAAGNQFEKTLERAVVTANSTLNGLCVELEQANKQKERANMLLMALACSLTGIVVGVITAFILR